MFACSRLKLMNIIFCSYLKPKRDYIWICKAANFIVVSLSIVAITGHLAEWMDVGLNEENETIDGRELDLSVVFFQQNIIICPLILFI